MRLPAPVPSAVLLAARLRPRPGGVGAPLLVLLVVALLLAGAPGRARAASARTVADFAARFHDATLRVDYHRAGDAATTRISLDQVYRQGAWAGSRIHLIDDLDLGRTYAHLVDAATGELLYSRGYDSYFGEYRTTAAARDGVWRTYHETVLVPCPRRPADLVLLLRQADQSLQEIFRVRIDPDAHTVSREPLDDRALVHVAHAGGEPHACLDVVVLGEGYAAARAEKFRADVDRFAAALLAQEPFASHAGRLNIRGVMAVSQDPGCDEPSHGVFARTPLGCTFDSLGSERYLLTEDNRAVRDLAAHVPYDALAIMVDHDRYGGGGIYNALCTFTSDNQWSEYVFVHEFGHHFGGLADEYYTSQIAYLDLYPRDREPREPNITILADPAQLRWRDHATPGVALPTPWRKAEYDAMDEAYQAERRAINERIAALSRDGGDPAAVARLEARGEELSRAHQDRVDAFFAASPQAGVVGAFEGAGYCREGMYRAELDCIMFSKGLKPFCAACRAHLVRLIARHGEG